MSKRYKYHPDYDVEMDINGTGQKTLTQMIEELAKIAEQKDKADRAKAAIEEAEYKAVAEKQAEDTAWANVITEAIESGVVDAGDIIDEICRMREHGMSVGGARRMIRSIISWEKRRLEEIQKEIQKAAPKPAAYGSWA